MLEFVRISLPKLMKGDLVLALRHSVNLVIIDGLCLGIDVAGDTYKREIMDECTSYLRNLEDSIFKNTNTSPIEKGLNFIENGS